MVAVTQTSFKTFKSDDSKVLERLIIGRSPVQTWVSNGVIESLIEINELDLV